MQYDFIDNITNTSWGRPAVAVLVFILWSTLSIFLSRLLSKQSKKMLEEPRYEEFRPLVKRTFQWLMVWTLCFGIFISFEISRISMHGTEEWFSRGVFSALALILGAGLTEGITRFISKELSQAQTPRALLIFAQAMTTFSLGYFTLLVLLSINDVSLTPLLGLGGIGLIPLLLFLERGASNLFYYLSLMRRQHLRVGDFIRLENGIAGTVTDVNWQDVRIRTKANNIVAVSNKRLADIIVTNYHLPDARSTMFVPISVTGGATQEVIETILKEELLRAAVEIPGISQEPEPHVKADQSKDSGTLSFMLTCGIEDIDLRDGIEDEILRRIARRFRKEQIKSPILEQHPSDDATRPSSTARELQTLVRSKFADTTFIVASNREPYSHTYDGASIRWESPASGMTTALDPVMRVLGGTWVAHGSGNADKAVTDSHDGIRVPPNRPQYNLRRIWLTKEQVDLYYNGFSNQAVWPLCHAVYIRPMFEIEQWESYKEVNQLFAETVLQEAQGKRAFIFVQDYHLALLPRMLKESGEQLAVAHFWHIPWPTAETISTCPWAEELIEGLLGNDLIGFHTRQDCNNFLDSADRLLECRVDRDRYSITKGDKQTLVRPFPISVDFESISKSVSSPPVKREAARFRNEIGLADGVIGLGVDRLDYTKGIPERLRAIDAFLSNNPEYKGRFVFVQVGVPSRTQITDYQRVEADVRHLVDTINWKHGAGSWKPIVYYERYFDSTSLAALYSIADFCAVSSLNDGMNLVAKEYAAARTSNSGVLLLSKFTGAAREFTDALQFNPWDITQLADLIKQAVEMPNEEQSHRMKRMRSILAENDIYRWAGRLLAELGRIELPEYHDLSKSR